MLNVLSTFQRFSVCHSKLGLMFYRGSLALTFLFDPMDSHGRCFAYTVNRSVRIQPWLLLVTVSPQGICINVYSSIYRQFMRQLIRRVTNSLGMHLHLLHIQHYPQYAQFPVGIRRTRKSQLMEYIWKYLYSR